MKVAVFFLLIVFSSVAQKKQITKLRYTFEIPSEQGSFKKNASLYYNATESLFVYDKKGQDTINSETSISIDKAKKGLRVSISHSDDKGKIIYRNFETKRISFRVNGLTPIQPFVVNDDWIEIDWKLVDEYKDIKGFVTQKAIGDFRGRTYTVWFTREIKVPYGPWKLFGLPGLILEAVDSREEVKMILKDLEICESYDKISKPSEAEEKSLIDYVIFMDDLLENVEAAMQSKIPNKKNITIRLDHLPSNKEKINKREYQIERRYRWEPGYLGKQYENTEKTMAPIDR